METGLSIVVVFAVTGIATFAIRFVPLAFLASFQLPRLIDIWLRNIVIAILSAMLFQRLFIVEGHLLIGWDSRLAGAIVSLIIAFLTKNIFFTVISGTTVVIILTIFS